MLIFINIKKFSSNNIHWSIQKLLVERLAERELTGFVDKIN